MRKSSRTRIYRAWLSFCCVALVCALTTGLNAQAANSDDQRSEFEAAIEAGVAALETDPEKAHADFERAHALHPSARTLLALGTADYKLDRFTAAKRELEAALQHTEQPLNAAMRQQVEEMLSWMRTSLGTVKLTISPAHAVVKLDKQVFDARELTLEPSEHELVVSADGFLTRERNFHIHAAQTLSLTVELTPVPNNQQPTAANVTVPPTAAETTSPPPADETPTLWPWLLGSTGAVGLISGTTLFILGQNDISSVENARQDVLLKEIESAHDRAPWLTGIGIGLGAAGIACMAVAAFELTRTRESHDSRQVSLAVTPTSLQIAGNF